MAFNLFAGYVCLHHNTFMLLGCTYYSSAYTYSMKWYVDVVEAHSCIHKAKCTGEQYTYVQLLINQVWDVSTRGLCNG